jgi:adenine-specific DNA methylase
MTRDAPRLIERAFPLKQTSLDSVHEKNVRHGHISTLHIWPARRPLAACRAALIATLLPDPGNDEERKALLERLGGRVVKKVKRKKLPSGKIEETVVEETEGGILHWGRESGPDLEWFRAKIREAYGGREPRVLDPFAGGGAILLEAMRLGCEATAIDINPVAWFILKCTLEYPQRLTGQTRPLPKFTLDSPEFMEAFLKGTGQKSRRRTARKGPSVQEQMFEVPAADLAWHVRAWGWWVLQRARADLERFYPVVDGKPTVAYLWARTVHCKNCRATIPLLKTRWLCKKDNKRVVLTMEPNVDRTGVVFGVQENVPVVGGNAAQRREHDKHVGRGTVSGSGATCPCCQVSLSRDDIRWQARTRGFGAVATATVVTGPNGKEYLPATRVSAGDAILDHDLARLGRELPHGIPKEPITNDAKGSAWCVDYGVATWDRFFAPRQILALGVFAKHTRSIAHELDRLGYPADWREAIAAYLGLAIGRMADFQSTGVTWTPGGEFLGHTFVRFALPIMWDYCEGNPLTEAVSGNYHGAIDWIARAVRHLTEASADSPAPTIMCGSVINVPLDGHFDAIVTDPPYYDAISYANMSDFFYVWHRRTLQGLSPEFDQAFAGELTPKWQADADDGELVDDASRFEGDRSRSKAVYEDGMYRAFEACRRWLKPEGYLVVVFAHKHPDAWEALVSAIIRAGYVADGSWPIQTERVARMRSLTSAALSSSIWLVCRRRPETARPGWDNRVLEEMRLTIYEHLREFWDAGIRGPDFVWAATGPALEIYSKHPVVKKANEPGKVMEVSEFLRHVRRIVVDFVVGRVLSRDGDAEAAVGLDDLTTYYLLHRHDFGMDDAPVGACILYAISCGLSDSALADQYDILVRTGGQAAEENQEDEDIAEDADTEVEEGTGSRVRLKPWQQRRGKNMGYDASGGRPVPLIDQAHRLMHLWRAGDVVKVDEYLDARGLRRHALFQQLLQALIELAPHGSEERSLLESISNHLAARRVAVEKGQLELPAS